MNGDMDFNNLYDTLPSIGNDSAIHRTQYIVTPVNGYESYYVGKDYSLNACLLIIASDNNNKFQAPIQLENLMVQFALRCNLINRKEPERVGIFNVIQCRSRERNTIRYFLSICETVVRMAGDKPIQEKISEAINHLAAIFQKLSKPPTRAVNGLFGELYFIWRSKDPILALRAWREDDTARFDFSISDICIDVKTTTGRTRVHTFSYEQCNLEPGLIAVVASLFVENSSAGIMLRSIIQQIEQRISGHYDLVMKLYDVVSITLGKNLNESLESRFNIKLADSSLQFYDLHTVPAIRSSLPVGVNNLHFCSNLSLVDFLSIKWLKDQSSIIKSILAN